MAKKKRGDAHGGGHGWFVTFADLMGLMMSFFVMLVAFSTMDNNKLKIVAGSMRDAFGVQTEARYSGIVETDGLPTRPRMKNTAHIPPEESSNTPSPDEQERNKTSGARLKIDREFALASASLRQALQDMPELTEISKQVMFEETSQGLNLEIVDQDGRSMCADAERLRSVRSFGGPRQRGAPDSRAGRAAVGAYFRGFGKGRQPATVSRRSDVGGEPSGDHHADARGSGTAARSEAVILSHYYTTNSCCDEAVF